MKRDALQRAGLVAMVWLAALPVLAANNSWNSTTSGFWHDPAKWSLGVVPTNTQSAIFISNSTSKTVTVDSVTSGSFPGSMTISNLTLSAPASTTTNVLLLSNAGLVTPLLVRNGLTNLTGCVLIVSNSALRVEGRSGDDFINDGIVRLLSGSMVITNAAMMIGGGARGSLTVSSGIITAKVASVGAGDPESVVQAQGSWTIQGGTNFVSNVLHIGENAGTTGAVWLTGGKLSVGSAIYVGESGLGGQLTVSNGLLEADFVYVADDIGGKGSLNLAGGTMSTRGRLFITGEANGAGTLSVTGGSLLMTNTVGSNGLLDFCFPFTAGSRTATMIVSNNSTVIVREVNMGYLSGSQSTLRLMGGTMTVTRSLTVGVDDSANATLWMTGGQLTVTNGPTFVGSNAVGQVTLSNGTVTVRELIISRGGSSQGTFTMAGGSVSADNLILTNAAGRIAFSNGTFQTKSTVVTNGLQFVVGNNTSPAMFQLLGGTHSFANGLRIATNAFLTGTGTINGVITNAGVFAPTGGFTVNGSLIQQSSARLAFQIAGYSQFDSINITNEVTLAGTLTVSLANGFESQMTNGASFTVLTAKTLTGSFVNVPSGSHLITTDGYADFVVSYGGGSSNVVLDQLQAVDSDGDQMPNWWEVANGFATNDASDATLDTDNDGQNNLAEFVAGTNPRDSVDVFKILSIERQAADVRIMWTAVGGKRYHVQVSASSPGGTFTNTFSDLGPPVVVPGSGSSTTNYVDSGAATSLPARYYRVKIVP